MSVIHDPKLECLLATLHARSNEQVVAMTSYHAQAQTGGTHLPRTRSRPFGATSLSRSTVTRRNSAISSAARTMRVGSSKSARPMACRHSISPPPCATTCDAAWRPRRRHRHRIRAREGRRRPRALRAGGVEPVHRSPGRRSARNTQADRRPGGFHAGGYLDRDGAAGTGAGRPASPVGRHRGLRQYPSASDRVCGLFRVLWKIPRTGSER